MCGIAGIVNFDGSPASIAELKHMNQSISHRGPDGDGFFTALNVGLAHRRLAIIDPKTGQQPFYNDDRSIVLSYNGEIYNYVELRQELASRFEFRTQSDTEVVLRAYEQWGIASLERFRGMFAFALYDSVKHLLYLVRDRVGIKPLFYYHIPQRLLFSSEIIPILRADHVRREINIEQISAFFRYQYIPLPASIYKDLYKVKPGHYLLVDTLSGNIQDHTYWDLAVNIQPRSEQDWLEELNYLLDDTVRMYVRSDVPFGAFLSGGVDSSLIAALMAKHLSQPVRTFTIGFQEEKHSELPYAAQASRAIHSEHYEKVVSPQLAEELLARMIVHFGEPFGDSSSIPTYYVSQVAAEQVKMVLSGDGGDELFAGYNSYPVTYRDYMRRKTEKKLRQWLAEQLRWKAKKFLLEEQIAPYLQDYCAARQTFGEENLRTLLRPEIPIQPAGSFSFRNQTTDLDAVTYFQAQDFKTYMVDDVLTKVDRMSMANSLEVRVPLLDHKVVELAFSLPLDLKLRWGERQDAVITKYLLKQSAARFYPLSFLERPKQGFGIPIVEWCQGPLRPLIEGMLRDSTNPIFQWVNFDEVQTMLNCFYLGNQNLVARIWYVLMLSLWEKYVHRMAS